MKPRVIRAFECDHLRPVVKLDNLGWVHVGADGRLGAPCFAGVYEVEASYTGDHYVTEAVS